MKCIVTKFSGFCHGVEYTISTIESLLKEKKNPVSCIGLPVHNPQVTEKLVASGLSVVNTLDDIREGTLVVRAHGLPPKEIQRAQEKGITIVNTTCGFVVKAQKIAKDLHENGYKVIITGERQHPEVQSLYGFSGERAVICSSPSDIEDMPLDQKVGVLSQTTFSEKRFKGILAVLLGKNSNELRMFNTICHAVEKRNAEAQHVASQVDMMLIIGGKMSSNTKRLFEACQTVNKQSFFIETKNDIKHEWLKGAQSVGITAGASTPQWIIDEVRLMLEKQQ